MKNVSIAILALSAISYLEPSAAFAQSSAATDQAAAQRRYVIVDLGPVVGPPGSPYSVANTGIVAGAARTSENDPLHAVLWLGKLSFDIGKPGLGGPNSMGFGVNDRGDVVGAAQNTTPNNEDFCGFQAYGLPGSNTTCMPFLWRLGHMQALPTLGGPNGYANRINSQGTVVGVAESKATEANCPVHQFEPVVWNDGKATALATFGSDTDGVAAWINDKGQVVGASGTCTAFNPNSQLYLVENHALLWENGKQPRDLGNLGGTAGIAGNHACAINNRSQVVGHSELTNNVAFHGFLWSEDTGHMQDLGTYPGDSESLAVGINDLATIVGASLDANFNPRAVVWDKSGITDLNKQIAGNSNLDLLAAEAINNIGEIVGLAVNADGELRGFLAIPTAGIFGADNGDYRPKHVLSERARRVFFERMRIRK